jgi:hypothetical protein
MSIPKTASLACIYADESSLQDDTTLETSNESVSPSKPRTLADISVGAQKVLIQIALGEQVTKETDKVTRKTNKTARAGAKVTAKNVKAAADLLILQEIRAIAAHGDEWKQWKVNQLRPYYKASEGGGVGGGWTELGRRWRIKESLQYLEVAGEVVAIAVARRKFLQLLLTAIQLQHCFHDTAVTFATLLPQHGDTAVTFSTFRCFFFTGSSESRPSSWCDFSRSAAKSANMSDADD